MVEETQLQQGAQNPNQTQGNFYGAYSYDDKFYYDLTQEKTELIRKLAREKNKGVRTSYDPFLMQQVVKLTDKIMTLAGNYDVLNRIKINYDGNTLYYEEYMKELLMSNKLQIQQTISKITLFSDVFFQLLAIEANMRKAKRTTMPWEKEMQKSQEKARAKREAEKNTGLSFPAGFQY